VRVDNRKLIDTNGYLFALEAPAGEPRNRRAVARGRRIFRSERTACHNVNQAKFVPTFIVPDEDDHPEVRCPIAKELEKTFQVCARARAQLHRG
jgi:hypothetical protein